MNCRWKTGIKDWECAGKFDLAGPPTACSYNLLPVYNNSLSSGIHLYMIQAHTKMEWERDTIKDGELENLEYIMI